MTAINGSAGMANDGLTRICCPGIKCLSLTGRELRREIKRKFLQEHKQLVQVTSANRKQNGFG